MVDKALAAANEQTVALPAEATTAPLITKLARQLLELDLARRLVDVTWALLRDGRKVHASPPIST